MLILILLCLASIPLAADGPLVTLTQPVETEFGTYRPYPVTGTPAVPLYGVDEDLGNVQNLEQFTLTDEQRALLHARRFFATPDMAEPGGTGYNEMYDVYLAANEGGLPVFVTSDTVLHTYHRFFDWILQNTEESKFSPGLKALDTALFLKAQEADEGLHASATFLWAAYTAVALKLLDPAWTVPQAYQDIVAQETALIETHEGYALSPLFQAYAEDYSQYKPRGHYTKSETLQRYFKAMMWHGRMTFVLRDDQGTRRPDLTGAALLLTQALASSGSTAAWKSLYVPTTFFVGKSDDALYMDYLRVARTVYGEGFDTMDPSTVLQENLVDAFITVAEQSLPVPDIPTQTPPGLRFMGQRFIPDSYMFTKLTYPNVEDRFLPRGLDIMALLGSSRAAELLDEMGDTALPGYAEQMEGLKQYIAQQPAEAWAQNLYWNWFYTLMPLLYAKGDGYPFFMMNSAWEAKDLNTALGSWTELRHDTILYAKQSASGTGVPPEYSSVLGYVEPNPGLYARLYSLTVYTREGLDRFGLLAPDTTTRLETFADLLLHLETMAEKELADQLLSAEEYETLSRFGSILRDLLTAPGGPPDPTAIIEEDPMPVVADVHTDPNSATCLEEGAGYPLRLLVAVPAAGRVFLAVGASFAYYEFAQPIGDRLTDEQWRAQLTGATPPTTPDWTRAYRDTASFSNAQPGPYVTEQQYIHVPVQVGVSPTELVISVGLPLHGTAASAFFGNLELVQISAEESEDGTRFIFNLPSQQEAPDGSRITLWISGMSGAFQYAEDIVLDRSHARPVGRPD